MTLQLFEKKKEKLETTDMQRTCMPKKIIVRPLLNFLDVPVISHLQTRQCHLKISFVHNH